MEPAGDLTRCRSISWLPVVSNGSLLKAEWTVCVPRWLSSEMVHHLPQRAIRESGWLLEKTSRFFCNVSFSTCACGFFETLDSKRRQPTVCQCGSSPQNTRNFANYDSCYRIANFGSQSAEHFHSEPCPTDSGRFVRNPQRADRIFSLPDIFLS